MTFIIAESDNVFEQNRKPFVDALVNVESEAKSRAETVIGNSGKLGFGELVAHEGEYAKSTLRPSFFSDSSGTQLTGGTFRQEYTGTGWNTILQADLGDTGNVGRNWILGLAGISIADATQHLTEIQLKWGDRTFPVMNVEEAKKYDKPVILFKISPAEAEQFVWDYSKSFTLEGNFASTGFQTVKPVGVAFVPQDKAISQSI